MLLELRRVTKSFGKLVALNDVSMSIDSGEIVGLIGPNGAGKSTLFNVITGFMRPSSGSVMFEGKDIARLRRHLISRLGISRTFQSVRPFSNFTVEQNVTAGALFGRTPRERVGEKVEEALEVTGLSSRRLATVASLPIEQRKLVEIGRALAASPKLLLLDEPMAGLNPAEVDRFLELIRRFNRMGVSLLIIEHVMRAIMGVSNRVVVLDAGVKLAEGPPEAVSRDSNVVSIYLGEEYARS